MEVGGHRKIGRPKLRWSDDNIIRKDMTEKGVRSENVEIENLMRRPQIPEKTPKK